MESTQTYSKKTLLFVQIAIYVTIVVSLARNCISLVLTGVAEMFPNESITTVQTVYSVISTGAIVGSLVAGKLAQIFPKKYILVADLVLGCLAAMYAYLIANTILALKVCSIIIGLTFGQFVPLTGALIAEYFDGVQRAKVVGLRVVFMNGGGLVMTLVAGQLAANYWKNTYLMFLLCIPAALACLFLLPKGSVEKSEAEEKGEKVNFFAKYMNKWLLLVLLMVVVQGIGYSCYLTNVSFAIQDLGLGGTSQASYISSVMQIACIATGFVMVPSVKLFKKCVPGAGLLGMAISFLILAFANGFVMLVLGAIVFGYSVILFSNGTVAIMPENVPSGSMTMSMALFNAMMNVGLTIAPYCVTAPAAMINNLTSTRYMVAAVIMAVGGLICVTVIRGLTKEVVLDKK